jgi:hypothetical protein
MASRGERRAEAPAGDGFLGRGWHREESGREGAGGDHAGQGPGVRERERERERGGEGEGRRRRVRPVPARAGPGHGWWKDLLA